jgi:hypothetical protein
MRFSRATQTLLASVFLTPSAVITAPRQALALCQVGAKASCSIDGKAGTKFCVGQGWGPCVATPTCTPTSVSGEAIPTYYVLTVLYAPPGSAAASTNQSVNLVSYADGSSIGTKTTMTTDVKEGDAVTFGGSGDKSSVGGNFNYNADASDATSVDITQNTSVTLSDPGPNAADGLDHNSDIIWLWLSPTVSLAGNSCSNKVSWGFGTSNGITQYVYVGWLKDGSSMPADVANTLQAHGVTSADYSKILAFDALANGGAPPSPRYTDAYFNFPYEPPFGANTSTPAVTVELNNTNTNGWTTTTSTSYSVNESISNILSVIGVSTSGSWTWTSQTDDTTGNSYKAILSVAGPSSAYTAATNPTSFEIYKDNDFNTYAFVALPAAATPTLVGAAAKPIAGQVVTATGVGGVTYHTVTNAKGEYKFFNPAPTNVKVGTAFTGIISNPITLPTVPLQSLLK